MLPYRYHTRKTHNKKSAFWVKRVQSHRRNTESSRAHPDAFLLNFDAYGESNRKTVNVTVTVNSNFQRQLYYDHALVNPKLRYLPVFWTGSASVDVSMDFSLSEVLLRMAVSDRSLRIRRPRRFIFIHRRHIGTESRWCSQIVGSGSTSGLVKRQNTGQTCHQVGHRNPTLPGRKQKVQRDCAAAVTQKKKLRVVNELQLLRPKPLRLQRLLEKAC